MEFELFELKNGIRFLHCEDSTVQVSHCAMIVNVGSRDETLSEQGLTHFIEHNLFKGTKKRRAFHILSGLDSVGGELNAYTSKEQMCVHASFQNVYYEKAIDLIADIIFNSTFPEKEIEKEKEVVFDEINSYLDSPSEQIFDDFEEQIFEKDPLGRNILGTIETVGSFCREDLVKFVEKHFGTCRMVVCSVGNIKTAKALSLLEKYFCNNTALHEGTSVSRKYKGSSGPNSVIKEKGGFQSHVMIGTNCFGANSPKRIPMILLNNILGGHALNSRLNLNIREKYGVTYNIESNYSYYSDTGIFSIYFGTDKKNVEKTRGLVLRELKKLKEVGLGTMQLTGAKKQLVGQISLASESKLNVVLSSAKQLFLFGKIIPLEEVYFEIDKITTLDLLELANEVFDPKKLKELMYQ